MSERIRVIHFGTGTAGSQALRAIIGHPGLELAGLGVHSAGKAGCDAGELCGLGATGVAATADFDELLAVDADCACYMLLLPDLEEITALLATGRNVVTTAGLMFPQAEDPEAARLLAAACQRGHSSLYVSGINPGFADEILPLAMSVLSRKIERVHIVEYADCARYPAPHIIDVMGFGKTIDDVDSGRVADMGVMRAFFRQSLYALAHGLDLALDEVRESRTFALTDKSYEIAAGEIAAGTIAGQRWRWEAMVDGVARIIQDTYWYTAYDLGEGYPAPGEIDNDTRWQVTLEGEPSLRCTFEPRHSFAGNDPGRTDYNPSALATAMAVVNTIEPVTAARPGLLTAVDLPQPRARWAMAGKG